MTKAEIDELIELMESAGPDDAETLWLQSCEALRALKTLQAENKQLRTGLLRAADSVPEDG